MKNLFENAYFGKAYKMSLGWKAIYLSSYTQCRTGEQPETVHRLVTEQDGIYRVDDSGNPMDGISTSWSIVSEWQESINEEELDRLANEYGKTIFLEEGLGGWEDGAEAFKAGYRKALEKQL